MEIEKIKGLDKNKASELLLKFGPNELEQSKRRGTGKILLDQLKSPLTLILLAVAMVSAGLSFLPGENGDIVDSLLIVIIVVLSVLAGFFQDWRAEKTIESLQKMSSPQVTVIRNGAEILIPDREVVPGDVVVLRAGDIIPADGHLLKADNFSVNESVLTGESESQDKKLGDEVFKGTTVQVGLGYLQVEKTGMKTKLGGIADTLQGIKKELTPFQKEIKRISYYILWFIAAIVVVIFLFSVFKFGLLLALLFSVSLAVAAIPEGLPAVMAVVLAIGAWEMVKRKALVRRLNAVESMGDVDVICTDKTGTLTKNEMSIAFINIGGQEFSSEVIPKNEAVEKILQIGGLCSKARQVINKDGKSIYEGSQTEVAISKLVERFSDFARLPDFKIIKENFFTHESKTSGVLCEDLKQGKRFVFVMGAPEKLLEKCTLQYSSAGLSELTARDREKLTKIFQDYAAKGLRVISFVFKEVSPESGYKEKDLVWLGLAAINDPVRPGIKEALKDVYQAGIRVIMLTGDYQLTAVTVAREVGIKSGGVITGEELEKMDDDQLKSKLKHDYNIFARISPFHKLRILKALRDDYSAIAMTGDGVNDALALQQADIGLAMGKKGTEVAKQASDIILLDDKFSTIRDAIREGRRSLNNIKKFINFLAVSNIAEVGVLFVATVFMTYSSPILEPVHILWINLITDGLPAIFLGLDPAQPNIMKEKPRRGKPLIDKKLRWQIGTIGLKKIFILFATFLLLMPLGWEVARTALFTGFILYEFVRIATIRKQENMPLNSNKPLLWVLLVSIIFQLVVIYTPLHKLFKVVPLPLTAWAVLLAGIILGYFSAIFIAKYINKKFSEAN